MDVQPHIKLADSSAIPSLCEVPVTACLTTLPKSSILTVSSCNKTLNRMLTSFTCLFFCTIHSALVYRWKASRPLCYLTQYKCLIESEILASLYLSAGGWRTQPSLCANQHCNFTTGSTCCIPEQICLYYEFMCQLHVMIKHIFLHYFIFISLLSCHFWVCRVIRTHFICLSSSCFYNKSLCQHL